MNIKRFILMEICFEFQVLCLTNLFCWMSLVCYSLYFTDFVGQVVYHGDPSAPEGTPAHERYEAGVRMGSLGMSLYSLSCSCYSLSIEKLVKTFGKFNRLQKISSLLFKFSLYFQYSVKRIVPIPV